MGDFGTGDFFTGQSWPQLLGLLIALVLCSLIGLERQVRQKSAGLRTHSLVGIGAALFVLVSKFGFGDVLVRDDVMLDPSRVAAQIVSGIGFIGAGLIFVRQDIVRGLTTAATVWVSAAVGSAAGAGLWLVAVAVTAAHFLVTFGYPWVIRSLSRAQPTTAVFRVRYEDGRGVLRAILALATEHRFAVEEVHTQRSDTGRPGGADIDLVLRLHGKGDANELAVALSETSGVLRVGVGEEDNAD